MLSKNDAAFLGRKYDTIVRLRRAAASDTEADHRRAMVALASEFPGSLREADVLPMAELERRLEILLAVARGERPPERWMHAMARFHVLTRGALCAKKWLRGRREVDDAMRQAFDVDAAAFCYGEEARGWRSELSRLANPPRGRVTDLVFERLAAEVGPDAETLRRDLFPARDDAP